MLFVSLSTNTSNPDLSSQLFRVIFQVLEAVKSNFCIFVFLVRVDGEISQSEVLK